MRCGDCPWGRIITKRECFHQELLQYGPLDGIRSYFVVSDSGCLALNLVITLHMPIYHKLMTARDSYQGQPRASRLEEYLDTSFVSLILYGQWYLTKANDDMNIDSSHLAIWWDTVHQSLVFKNANTDSGKVHLTSRFPKKWVYHFHIGWTSFREPWVVRRSWSNPWTFLRFCLCYLVKKLGYLAFSG